MKKTELFTTFFRIGLFTIGGGYAMIPLIEAEVVEKHKWIDRKLFLDLIAVAQTCPGVFAINIAIFIGYRLQGIRGAVCTAMGTAMPSLLIILAIAMFFQNFQHIPWVAAMFAGIRPAVVALMAVPTFNMDSHRFCPADMAFRREPDIHHPCDRNHWICLRKNKRNKNKGVKIWLIQNKLVTLHPET